MAHRRRTTRQLAVATGLGVILSTVFAAVPANAAEPFTQEELKYDYPSNAAYDYIPIMDLFTDIVNNQPGVVALNDATTVRINRTATATEIDRAIVDQYADMSLSMADGLGVNLGAIYTAAMAAGELPKTKALISKDGGLVGYYSSTNPAKDFFDYDRPYIRFEAALVKHDKPGGNVWSSTSGSYPSGHTSQAYWQGTTLATLLPELSPQILARTSEAGNNRIVLAAHYPLDVMSGRMMGQHIVERRWSDAQFRVLFEEASAELRAVLEAECGDTLAACIAADTPYMSDEDALAVYEERLAYDFVQTGAAGQDVTVPANAESLLLTSHPTLTDAQRRQVLEMTATDSGYPLDEAANGSWERINLSAAMAADVVVNADGTVSFAADVVVPTPTTPPTENPAVVVPVDVVTPGGTTVNDTATGAAADGELAATGTEVGGALAAALALLVAGAAVMVRRRRITARN
ncbi:PAP2 superfamily protein [Glaciihabitans tibetensis]|uniref:acid phosphatase n=1 Tax=Glaciihabitans tibetensis TaxID=1266600 RepID=A0A2T0VAU6_9MICO|nr:phosphatase PAP2 family protein [Glaciihabitans tibetensis]PRY67312.1 PAP2 superfamily protein [Glaciihabitans tibetensis]